MVGWARLKTCWAYSCPMSANWVSWDGVQSTVAPTSRRIVWPVNVGRSVAMAGRSTPFRTPSRKNAVTTVAPVFPALMMATASPFLTSSVPTQIEESRLRRTTCEGCSCISTRWEAWCTVKPGRSPTPCRRSSALSSVSSPTRTTSTPYSRTANAAPSTSEAGA